MTPDIPPGKKNPLTLRFTTEDLEEKQREILLLVLTLSPPW